MPVFSGTPGGRKRILRKKDSRGQIFWREEEAVCDVEMLSSKFFHERRVNSGLDSHDSDRIGLGLSPVGSCRLPLKEQGHRTRLEVDASNLGFGLILGDFRGRAYGGQCKLLRAILRIGHQAAGPADRIE